MKPDLDFMNKSKTWKFKEIEVTVLGEFREDVSGAFSSTAMSFVP
jgi:hypothetical protein